jgi:uncharacterized repeat protein (TIGR01451 family)
MSRTETILRTVGLLVCVFALLLANSAFAQANLSTGVSVSPTFDIDAQGNQTYTAQIMNSGSSDATNTIVTFAMPSDDIPISGTPACLFTPSASGLTAACAMGTLAAGATGTAIVVVHPTAVGDKDVTATAVSGSISASGSTTSQIIEVGISDVQLTLTDAPDPAQVGSPLTYSITASNLGDDSAANVSVTLTMPVGVRFVSAPKGCTQSGSLVTCRGVSLNPGASVTYNIKVTPTVSGWLYASAGVRLTTPDPSFANNSAAARTWVNP